jgi:peptide/nickel transport system substrate-binding protein
MNKLKLGSVICFGFFILFFGFYSSASAKEYDGIWFLGFNLEKPPFDNLKVRQAVAHCLDKDYISVNIMEEESAPVSIVPPGMDGYDPALKPYKKNVKFAKTLLKRAKYSPADPRLKNLRLLHTDGVKTIEIAKKVQQDLKQIGIKLNLVQVSYRDEEKWDRELRSGQNQLFLMGYKAESRSLFTDEASAQAADSYRLLEPLFKSGAEANFTGYSDPKVDMLLDQISVIGTSFLTERETKLKEINRALYKELPLIVLFYIEKL